MFMDFFTIQFEIKEIQSVSKDVRTRGVNDILIYTYLGPDFPVLRTFLGDVDEDDDDAHSGQYEPEHHANLMRLERH